jgi:hypothetical protein
MPVLLLCQDWYEGITRKLKWNQSIRGISGTTSGGLETAILQKAAAAASRTHAAELQPQLSLGGLVSDLTAAAHNEAKVRTAHTACHLSASAHSLGHSACVHIHTVLG